MGLKPGYKQMEAGIFPNDWNAARLGQIGHWFSGGTPSMAVTKYWDGDIPWVSSKDMKVSRIYDAQLCVTEEAIGNGTRLAPAGAVLVVVRGMILAHTFPVAIANRPVAFNQDLKALSPTSEINSEFILHWLRVHENEILAVTSESTHGTKRIATEDLFAVAIAVPPASEQRIIAKALSDADALIESLESLIAKKRQITQGAMQELLTGKRRLPGFSGKWRESKLGELGVFLKGSGIRKDEANSGPIPCVRYGELYTHHNDHVRDFFSHISASVAATAVRLHEGDILFAGSGETKEEIGKCAAIVVDAEAYAGGDIIIFRDHRESPSFLGYYLNSPLIATQKARRGQGDAVVHIGATALGEIAVCLPDRKEQDAIAEIIVQMDDEVLSLESKLSKARAIKQGMMQELLTGRIRLV